MPVPADLLEVRIPELGLRSAERPGSVLAALGLPDGDLVDVVREDPHAGEGARAERPVDRDGHRIGLLAARATGRPEHDGPRTGVREAPPDEADERFELLAVTEEERLLDGERGSEAPDEPRIGIDASLDLFRGEVLFGPQPRERTLEAGPRTGAGAEPECGAELPFDGGDGVHSAPSARGSSATSGSMESNKVGLSPTFATPTT